MNHGLGQKDTFPFETAARFASSAPKGRQILGNVRRRRRKKPNFIVVALAVLVADIFLAFAACTAVDLVLR